MYLYLYMSYSLNSLKGVYIGDYIGNYYRGYSGGYQEFRLYLYYIYICTRIYLHICAYVCR